MSHADEQGLRWEAGVPVSDRFDDPYYSRRDGLAETRHVFHDGCGLPGRWQGRPVFTIAELGFGTGLNFCATWRLWSETSGPGARLRFVSFERFPLDSAAILRALALWPELDAEARALAAVWRGQGARMDFGPVTLEAIVGDARETVPLWQERADCWFLDGFAPARNPEMWEPALLEAVARRSAPGATLATYSAAGAVRRGLDAAGFAVSRRLGFGSKRDMTVACLRESE